MIFSKTVQNAISTKQLQLSFNLFQENTHSSLRFRSLAILSRLNWRSFCNSSSFFRSASFSSCNWIIFSCLLFNSAWRSLRMNNLKWFLFLKIAIFHSVKLVLRFEHNWVDRLKDFERNEFLFSSSESSSVDVGLLFVQYLLYEGYFNKKV